MSIESLHHRTTVWSTKEITCDPTHQARHENRAVWHHHWNQTLPSCHEIKLSVNAPIPKCFHWVFFSCSDSTHWYEKAPNGKTLSESFHFLQLYSIHKIHQMYLSKPWSCSHLALKKPLVWKHYLFMDQSFVGSLVYALVILKSIDKSLSYSFTYNAWTIKSFCFKVLLLWTIQLGFFCKYEPVAFKRGWPHFATVSDIAD